MEQTTDKTYTIDASRKRLGRVATEVAHVLMGKNSPAFRKNIAPDVTVMVENVGSLNISPKKLKTKEYIRHSGYPGGLKRERMEEVVAKKGYDEVLRYAVRGMLPKNKLRAVMMKNLVVKV